MEGNDISEVKYSIESIYYLKQAAVEIEKYCEIIPPISNRPNLREIKNGLVTFVRGLMSPYDEFSDKTMLTLWAITNDGEIPDNLKEKFERYKNCLT